MADEIFQRAWGHYIGIIEELVNAGGNKQGEFQPNNLATLVPYSADTPFYNQYLLLNAINYVAPTSPIDENEGQWADDQIRHPDLLTEGYRYFLDDLDAVLDDFIKGDVKRDIQKLRVKLAAARSELRSRTREIDMLWADYLSRHPDIPPEEFEARKIMWMWQYQYGAELEDLKKEVRRVRVKIGAKQRRGVPKEYWTVIDAKARFEDPTQHMLLPTHSMFEERKWMHMWRRFPNQFPQLNLSEFLANSTKVSRTRDIRDEDYYRVETHWKVKAKARWKIFSGGGSTERRDLEEISNNKNFKITISFDRIDETPITRDDWYADILFTTVGKRFTDYWGAGGIIASIPYSLVVARGTTIDIAVGKEYKRRVESYVRTKGSFSVGPFFSAGGDYSKDERHMRYTSTAEGFRLSDGANTVRILGARVRNFNWEEERSAEEYYKPIDYKTAQDLERINYDEN